MSDHFLKTIAKKSRADFRCYYTLQNLKAVKTLCIIFWGLNLSLRLLLSLFPKNITRIHNFPEFNLTNWIFVVVAPIFYVATYFLYKEIKKTHKATFIMSVNVVAFAFFIIVSGMISSFLATYIPSDNPITFMIALTVIGAVCVFEYSETWLLTLLSGIIFTFVLLKLSSDPTEILYNELIAAILLTGFFFISRYNYSYRANHFLQLVEISQKNIEIEKASNFKNEVLGMVAHDLRNPIGAVETIAMLMELDDVDENTQENLTMIKASCVKARSIINDLLEVARNENASFETQKTEVNMLLKSIVNTWRVAKKLPNNIIFKSEQDPAYVFLNTEKFHRVIDNLVSNASKFSKETDPIEVLLSKEDNRIVIEVKDYGMGIPANMLPRIFDRFSAAGRAGIRGEQSTGLGLSIVHQIVEKHKGRIEVESEVGKGSVFRMYLPEADEVF
ncbi:hypothetical protein DJ568_05090 [Mucilaginibacter hurinus]|uniref:histidine kinase n=1 Tax=Mucilaginibacter hurinus TaxID=2201324 RepID=A0A367GTT8_9SPHI|nr:hypothetical protein DJ568_05090 [Mucilaginibacter hurinus]